MRRHIQTVAPVILMLATFGTLHCHGQAAATATQFLRVSAFGGITGTYTGLYSAKNLGVTAGVDLDLRPHFSLYPSLEVRGTYPIARTSIVGQKNILAGVKVAKPIGRRFRPYADFFFGRGEITYASGYAIPGPGYSYSQSVSNVFAPGVGVDYRLTNSFSLKADGQFQRYATPLTDSGHLYAKAGTFGAVYLLDFNHWHWARHR